MSTKIAKFQFYTSAYFGEAGIGVEESSEMVHSDTIFSAICHAWGIVYGKTDMESMLAKFKDAAPFLITSCFLYSNETFFLPKPHTLPPGFENAEIREEFGKKVKNISFLPFELFEQWAKREKIENYLKKVVLPDYDSCYQFDLIPRATIDRSTLNAQIFRMKTVRFNKDCGLYCIVKINDLSIEEKIKSSLEYLGESGLGGKRNIGLGRYKLCWEDINEKWKNLLAFKGNAHCTLSLYHMNIEGVFRESY
ncbi:type III-A CRISPR-associated RAMP protein Csm4 [Candidatus Kuenenia stuttgartiensis]|uniref:type III-A CRISPR-associated RAMP protein Csm4 n=1 Tax=Kuenenia stuttgartiensis TaxID=174633 RepID=UPI00146B6775|nr:type III-A CRISPR-associated RAMP protein Csm4 [Candidatus Kuenenia stuttgartiensis]